MENKNGSELTEIGRFEVGAPKKPQSPGGIRGGIRKISV